MCHRRHGSGKKKLNEKQKPQVADGIFFIDVDIVDFL